LQGLKSAGLVTTSGQSFPRPGTGRGGVGSEFSLWSMTADSRVVTDKSKTRIKQVAWPSPAEMGGSPPGPSSPPAFDQSGLGRRALTEVQATAQKEPLRVSSGGEVGCGEQRTDWTGYKRVQSFYPRGEPNHAPCIVCSRGRPRLCGTFAGRAIATDERRLRSTDSSEGKQSRSQRTFSSTPVALVDTTQMPMGGCAV
jgi:hypothetical protein